LKEKRTIIDNVWRDQDEYLHKELFLFAIIGATYMEEAVTEFPAWSKTMLAEDDTDDLRPFLRVVYVNAKTLLEKFRKLGWDNISV
jgi:hypothetical protein